MAEIEIKIPGIYADEITKQTIVQAIKDMRDEQFSLVRNYNLLNQGQKQDLVDTTNLLAACYLTLRLFCNSDEEFEELTS